MSSSEGVVEIQGSRIQRSENQSQLLAPVQQVWICINQSIEGTSEVTGQQTKVNQSATVQSNIAGLYMNTGDILSHSIPPGGRSCRPTNTVKSVKRTSLLL